MNFTKRELRNFDLAKQASYFSDFPRIKIGSVIILKNKVVGVGFNSTKTKPIQYRYNQKYRHFKDGNLCERGRLHAEFSAILNAESLHDKIDWSRCEIYNFRINSLSETGMCRPCSSCGILLKEKGLTNWYYTSDVGYIYECAI